MGDAPDSQLQGTVAHFYCRSSRKLTQVTTSFQNLCSRFCPMSTMSQNCQLWQRTVQQMEVSTQYSATTFARLSVVNFGHSPQVRSVLHLEQTPGIISLLAGKPHPSTFPFTSFSFTIRDPVDPSKETAVQLTQEELDVALQYSAGQGIPPLLEWAYGLQEITQGRKRGEGWRISFGNGSQDLIYKVFWSSFL